jgi:hypothetical protein
MFYAQKVGDDASYADCIASAERVVPDVIAGQGQKKAMDKILIMLTHH